MASDARDALAVIPWYWRDWRASKARAFLVSDPHALMAYREILDAMWGETDCSIPDDDETLAALAGLTLKAWKRVREKVMRFLVHNEAGRVTHPRSQHEYRKALAYREGCRAGGKATAEKRWGSGSHPTSPPTAEQQPSNGRATALSTPSPSLFSTSDSDSVTTTAVGSGGAVGGEPKAPRVYSRREQIARDLKKATGSGLDRCRDQVTALITRGLPLDRIEAGLALAEPGMGPWEWSKRVAGGGGGALTGDQIRALGARWEQA